MDNSGADHPTLLVGLKQQRGLSNAQKGEAVGNVLREALPLEEPERPLLLLVRPDLLFVRQGSSAFAVLRSRNEE